MKLFFRKYGSGDPLIILHGLFGSADNWNTLAKRYGEYFTTYVVDQRNHGQSPHDEVWNYDVMAEDLDELMTDENISSAHIMGHSMGGKTAMFFAGKYAHKVNKLVVSDMSPRYYAPHHQVYLKALNGLNLGELKTRKEAEAYMESMIDEVGVRQFLLKNLYWKEDRMAWRFNLEVIDRDIENAGQALPEDLIFEGPALFVRGEKSNYIREEDIDLILQHFPQALLATIPGSGHWIHADKPLEYLETTLEFLR